MKKDEIAKKIRTMTFKTPTGGIYYVAQIGNTVKDRVGRESGFKSHKTSKNLKTTKEVNSWIKDNIK